MRYQKVLELANKFADATGQTAVKSPDNVDFRAQRARFGEFYEMFRKQLRTITGEMEQEIMMLKYRGFDPAMLKLFSVVRWNVIEIYKETKEDTPYAAAEKFVHYVTGRGAGRDYIENLDFLVKNFLAQDAALHFPHNPSTHSLELLKALAESLKHFMSIYPVVKPPSNSNRPASLQENVINIVPEGKAGPGDVTKVIKK